MCFKDILFFAMPWGYYTTIHITTCWSTFLLGWTICQHLGVRGDCRYAYDAYSNFTLCICCCSDSYQSMLYFSTRNFCWDWRYVKQPAVDILGVRNNCCSIYGTSSSLRCVAGEWAMSPIFIAYNTLQYVQNASRCPHHIILTIWKFTSPLGERPILAP